MLYYAVTFVLVGLVAGALNLAEGSLVVVQMSWMLFLIGVALMAMSLLGRRAPPVRALGDARSIVLPRG